MNKTYIGARYVPKIEGVWSINKAYESLSIVTNGTSSYTSKKNVPIGIDINNTEYWILTGQYSDLDALIQNTTIDGGSF